MTDKLRLLARKFARYWENKDKNYRQKEKRGQIARPYFAYGLLKAADVAAFFGAQRVTACEFGVARGDGLINMTDVAAQVTHETGIGFDIFGFDTGTGLTAIDGYRDHPEIWTQGDYPMTDPDSLIKKLAGKAQLVLGDIADTVPDFTSSLSSRSPLGFIAVDVDIYSSTAQALRCLLGPCDRYNPAVSIYFDDVSHFFANRYCGELLAIDEFNAANAFRKIDHDRTGRHLGHVWHEMMYACHILDHPARSEVSLSRPRKTDLGGNLPAGVLD